eukprot:3301650-Amphidinium_carterae.1
MRQSNGASKNFGLDVFVTANVGHAMHFGIRRIGQWRHNPREGNHGRGVKFGSSVAHQQAMFNDASG